MIKNLKKGLLVFGASTMAAMSAMLIISTNADESTESPSDIPVGTAYLEYRGVDETISLEGGMIYADGQYDMTWDVSDSGINESENIGFCIKNQYPNPLGIKNEVDLSVDEIWIDGEKLDKTLNGKPTWAIMTDSIYTSDEVVQFNFSLRNSGFNDLDMTINDDVRIVFTMTNLIDPSTYRDEHPTQPPMPTPPATEEPTTEVPTEEATVPETTESTTTAAKTTTTANKTTTAAKNNNPPKTGDSAVAGIIAIAALAGAAAYISKK